MERENRKISRSQVFLAIVGAIAVVVSVIIGGLSLRSTMVSDEDDDGLAIEDLGGGKPYIYYSNLTYIESIMGVDFAGQYNKGLTAILLHDGARMENRAANGLPDEAYVLRINNSSLQESVRFPFSIYDFSFSISDGREYAAHFAINGTLYAGILLYRTQPSQQYADLYIQFDGNNTGAYDRDAVVRDLVHWAKGIYPEGVVVTTEE